MQLGNPQSTPTRVAIVAKRLMFVDVSSVGTSYSGTRLQREPGRQERLVGRLLGAGCCCCALNGKAAIAPNPSQPHKGTREVARRSCRAKMRPAFLRDCVTFASLKRRSCSQNVPVPHSAAEALVPGRWQPLQLIMRRFFQAASMGAPRPATNAGDQPGLLMARASRTATAG